METKWTDDQKEVIVQRDSNILVSAAAGSGKTAVLVERIINMVTSRENPVDIDRILVLTFTRAAAGEMKGRIREAIDKALENNPTDKHLQRQATLIHNAQIRTIDSFCAYVVRNYFHEINIEPDFRTASEDELKIIKQQVMKEVLNQNFENPSEDFKNLCDSYIKGLKVNALSDMLFSIYRVSQSFPYPKEWLANAAKAYDCDSDSLLKEQWLEVVSHICIETARSVQSRVESCLEVCKVPSGPDHYIKTMEQDMARLDMILACSGYGELFEVLSDWKWDRIAVKKNFDGDEAAAQYVKDQRDAYKKIISGLKNTYFFESPEKSAEVMGLMRPAARELLRLTGQFADSYMNEKLKKNILDFNDVEHFALDILRKKDSGNHEITDTAKELASNFYEVMVDEYQDSNYLQEAILTAVCTWKDDKTTNYFNVGDIKQSIYSFRQATPELFNKKYEEYSLEKGTGSRRIDLHKNFRSRHEVLDFTNDIFSKIMKKDLGGVDYDSAAALYLGAEYIESPGNFDAEIIVGDLDDIQLNKAGISSDALEGIIIGQKIRQLMKSQLVSGKDEKGNGILRPLRYSDVVILLRSAKERGQEIMGQLNDMGIPTYMASETGYFARPEIETLLAMLAVADNSYQDIPIATVLHSPMFGVTDEELAQIRREYNTYESSFANAVFSYSIAHPENEKLARFTSIVQEMRDRAMDCPIHELMEWLLKETGYLAYVSALPEGEAKKANIRRLLDEAIAYEKDNYRSLSNFIHYIETLKTYEVDKGLASTISENDDVVRIITIHKSKGLEYPVVFLSGTGKEFNLMDAKDAAICNPTYGLALKYINPEKRTKQDTLIHRVFAEISKMDSKGEELRILYVAMTRAKEKLIVTGVKKNLEKMLETGVTMDSDGALSLPDRLSSMCYLKWILDANKALGEKYPVEIKTGDDILYSQASDAVKKMNLRAEIEAEADTRDEDRIKIIDAATGFEYKGSANSKYKNKYSVSELKHAAMAEALELEADSQKPDFLTRKGTDKTPAGALYGTAVHRVWECFDFAREDYQSSLEKELNLMVEEGSLSASDRTLLRENVLQTFLDSELAGRMHRAAVVGELYKEQPFVFGDSPSRLFNDSEASDSLVLIQGIIDVFFVEEDGIVLMDYKTDKVDTAHELVLRYQEQLNLYKNAIERAYSEMKVKEILIYSFSLGETIELENEVK